MKRKVCLIVMSFLIVLCLLGCNQMTPDIVGGKPGKDGTNGKSAYELAVDKGYTGTEEEWLASLVGAKGDKGETGSAGADGKNGKSAYELAVDKGYTGTEAEWLASLVGEAGKDGANGKDGKSAYELAVENGFEGSVADWLLSLVGQKGEKGDKGDKGDQGAPGQDGKDGTNGKSAYELAVDKGYTGTEEEWLASLVGAKGDKGETGSAGADGTDGKSAYELAVDKGYTGTEAEWLATLVGEAGKDGVNGKDGKSAYELAVENGFEGSLTDWLLSLVGQKGEKGDKGDKGDQGEPGQDGKDGTNGKSAYELAVDKGYTGTEEEWLASLVGAKGDKGETGSAGADGKNGKSAYELAVDKGYTGTEAEWLASLVGDAGKDGANGKDGKSAYELAVENGFEGSLTDWLLSLVGQKGEKGDKGDKGDQGAPGQDGKDGADGKSAYELAVDKGYTGTEEEWLASLVGAKGETGSAGADGKNGKSAYDLAVDKGYTGTEAEWLASLVGEAGKDGANGKDGKSAYELAVENGFEGSITDWLLSLVGQKGEKGDKGDKGDQGTPGQDGKDGADGKSAYEVAVDNGYTGTLEEWLESLKGQDLTACDHTWSDWVLAIKPSCTSIGYSQRTCSKCGMTEYKFEEALEHEWKFFLTAREVDCETDGFVYYWCTRCNLLKIEMVSAIGHDYGDVLCVWSEDYSQCTATRICKNDKNHIETEIVSSSKTVVQEKNCTLDEVTKFVAVFENDVFGTATKEVVTDVHYGHEWSETWTIDVEPTADADGSKSHHCIKCDEKNDITVVKYTQLLYSENEDGQTCTITGVKDVTFTNVVIPFEIDGLKVTMIAEDAFKDCVELSIITIEAHLEKIGANAFITGGTLSEIIWPSDYSVTYKYTYSGPGYENVYFGSEPTTSTPKTITVSGTITIDSSNAKEMLTSYSYYSKVPNKSNPNYIKDECTVYPYKTTLEI